MPETADFCGFSWYRYPIRSGLGPPDANMLMVCLMVARPSPKGDTIMALTAAAIKNAKGRTKAYKLTDSDGLFLYVRPTVGATGG